ncbi:interferon-induced protein 44-like isoform X2 [Betta splendens]|nr:interferon-induced protein 44-like isoform X2 [Betta splendens]XP_055361186.1 interferon-induced protein 44-like isoform X2 [Betta splendens]XP_055361187.1 interferon-induced protein 44-like isoform X2 [Betta splendens]
MEIPHLRVLVYGPVGSGKSSFINSVSSVFRKRICSPSLVNANNDENSFTKKHKSTGIHIDDRKNSPSLLFSDIMGLEDGTKRGVSVEDVKLILEGHMKDDYKFNPVSPLSTDDPHYNPAPSKEDKVHVLVWVCSANATEINVSVVKKMKNIRETASEMGIPQFAVLTKIDEACAETEKDLKNVYRSKYVKQKMTNFSTTLGIPLNCIFPVKNYSDEIELDNDVDCLILSIVKKIIHFGNDFVNETVQEQNTE